MALEFFGVDFTNYLYGFIIPFLLVFVLSYGIFRRFDFFRNSRIDLFLSLAISVLFASTTTFGFFAGYMTQLSTMFIVGIFVAIFVLGISTQVYKKGKIIERKPYIEDLERMKRDLWKEREEAVKKNDTEKIVKIDKILEEIDRRIMAEKEISK